ncbi:MAG TPA: GWxTD domain-containing protein [Thermoanaerobaculia bacterium]|nr:GWxTD domain-containing protein [Thermoanaerobaculia bacterium]
MRRICILAVIAVFAVASLFAANLGAYKDWDQSPTGYFMTKAEREEFSKLSSEAEAAKFADAFMAKRDLNFPAEVKKRTENADKYLTIGKIPGSKTLRGKVIILMGPPTGLNVTVNTKTETKRDSPAVAGAYSNIGPSGGGGRNTEAGSLGGASISTGTEVRTYTISYDGKAAKTVDRAKVSFVIDADGATGKDRFVSREQEKDAQQIFELAAQASIRK